MKTEKVTFVDHALLIRVAAQNAAAVYFAADELTPEAVSAEFGAGAAVAGRISELMHAVRDALNDNVRQEMIENSPMASAIVRLHHMLQETQTGLWQIERALKIVAEERGL